MFEREKNTFIAIDMKSFYASVECVDRGLDPLTARLVVADESRTDKTICLAVSPALKKYGLSGRSRLFEVRQVLSSVTDSKGDEIDYIIAPPRMARYMEVSSEVYSTYLEFFSSEDIHPYSIDECFIDITHYLKLHGMDAHELTLTVIRRVLKKTGVTATAGIGTNMYLAKIAMDITAKHMEPDEDGVRIAYLDEMAYREKLWGHRPLTDFWRIGRGTARKLEKIGIMTMGDIALLSSRDCSLFYQIFGIDAEFLIDHAWGYEPCTMADIKNYKPKSNSITAGQVLHEPYAYKDARIVIREMGEEVALELMSREMVTESLTMSVGYDRCSVDDGSYDGDIEMDFYGRLLPKRAHGTIKLNGETDSAREIGEAAVALFEKIANPELPIRRMSIDANRITGRGGAVQLSLFDNVEEQEKDRKIQAAMMQVKHKYGKNALVKGTNLLENATAMDRNRQIGGHKA